MPITCRVPRAHVSVLVVVALSILGGCGDAGPPAGDAASVPEEHGELSQGRLVSIGGGLSAENEAVYREILGAREGEGPICVIPTAGASPEGSMRSAVERIERWGGEGSARGIFISTENPESAEDPDVVEEIRGCGGFFFTGGVQSRIVDVFRPEGEATPAYRALWARFEEGAVVSGSSAGAAMMSHPMIAGGSSDAAFQDGLDGGVRLADGMGFTTTLLADQHFLARGRIGRLIVALLADPAFDVGAGIDENTALVVEGPRAWVVGASGVVLVDATGAVRGGASPAEARGLRIELLGHGDTLDLRTLAVRGGTGKRAVSATAHSGDGRASAEGAQARADEPDPMRDYPDVPADALFESWFFLHLFHRLALEPGQTIEVRAADHRIGIRTAPDHRAVAFPEAGVRGTPHGLSVGPLHVEIVAAPAREP